MAAMITYSQCPCCKSTQIAPSLQATDFTVTQQSFQIWHCSQCTLRFTQAVADASGIGVYYQSAAYVSHSDTKEGLVNRLYHLVRNYTLQTKRKLVQQATGLKQGAMLDVGAGTGAFAHTMQQAGWVVTALEPEENARKVAHDKYQLKLQDPANLYQIAPDSFHAITLWHVLEHVHDLQGYMQAFNAILKPNGQLIIAVPNYTSYDARYYQSFWAAYDVPRHLYHFSPKSMQQLAASNGFVVKAHQPMWFDSVYVSMLSEQYKNGKPSFIKALFRGLISNLQCLGNPQKCSSVIYVLEKA